MSLANKLSSAWNAFMGLDSPLSFSDPGIAYSSRPDESYASSFCRDKNVITPIINKISVDVSSLKFKHVFTDSQGRYISDVESDLNTCLNLSANIDQTARSFIKDYAYSLLEEGDIAIIPVDTDSDPNDNDGFTIQSIRVARIIQWKPRSVQVNCYNERTGKKEDIWISKSAALIIENPFKAIMNEKNSMLQRLISKMALLDRMDNNANSNKLDLIIQLPYVLKSQMRKKQAEERKSLIERQLEESKYGIAYIDGTEKIIQLNRPVENNLPAQIDNLKSQAYSQLGMTDEILNGTADAKTMTNYFVRIIEPIASAFVEEARRKWLTKNARSRGYDIMYFRNHFELIPVNEMASIADSLTRNAIVSSNEFRQFLGLAPDQSPDSDMLRNKNLYPEDATTSGYKEESEPTPSEPVDDGYDDDTYGHY